MAKNVTGRVGNVLAGVRARARKAHLTDRAAALTYYGFLSLIPALLVAVTLLALVGSFPETYNSIIDTLREAAPGTAIDAIDSALREVLSDRGNAAGLLGISLIVAFWSASGAVGAALRAIAEIHGAKEPPPLLQAIRERLLLTLAIMVLVLVAFIAAVIAGPLFRTIADAAGLGDLATTIVSVIRWPIGAAAIATACVLLYARGSGSKGLWSRRLVPGALAATGLWILASIAFTLYVANFGSYNATY
ncbi:MAG: YihY/virulence factor BrkB family protein [Solirubrobacterales bacterium]